MEQFRMPGDLDISMRLFGRLTVPDLLRISLPVLPGLAASSLLAAALGLVIGVLWYGIRPYGKPVDRHLYQAGRWLLTSDTVEGRDVEQLAEGLTAVGNRRAKTQSGSFIAVIQVQPTNLDLKTGAEQQALHRIYQELFQTVNYPVQIHSRQRQLDLKQYLEKIENRGTGQNLLKQDYIEYCEGFGDEDLTLTEHFIVVHTQQDSVNYIQEKLPDHDRIPDLSSKEDTGDDLEGRCREIIDAIDSSDLSAERLTDRDLEQFIRRVDRPTDETTPRWTVQDDYRRSIRIDEYPSNVDLAWPVELLRTPGRVNVVQKVEPLGTGETTKQLQRLSEKLNAEIDSLLTSGHRGTNRLEGLLDDTDWFLNLLADRKAQPVKYSTCITVRHENQDQAKRGVEKLCNRLDTLGFSYTDPVFQADLAYRSDSPLYRNGLDNELLVPASSAAAGFPFATQDTEDTGVIYGTDSYDRSPVLLDRFNWSSHSMARMGMVGSGKSYATKIELLRTALIYKDVKIVVVDPKQEYDWIVHKLGGERYTASEGFNLEADATCITVEERGQKDNVEHLTNAVEQVYSSVSQDTRKTLVVIDEARILLNDEDGRRILNQFVLEGRDTNTAVTLVTQNASHFTHHRQGREILDNMPGKMFMRHDRVPDSVVDYFELSQREKQELFELKTGTDSSYSEALIHVSGQVKTRLEINATPQEHAVIQAGEQ